MKKSLFVICMLLFSHSLLSQVVLNSDSLYKEKHSMTGRLWGYAFGDYYFKGNSDSLNRGGINEYTGIEKKGNAFTLRRVYMGYDFNINKKFSTHILLAAEKWSATQKFGFYLKNANVRWHNIWKGTDLIIGEQTTPTFALTKKLWNYRSIEKGILVKRGIQTYDLGISLKGTFDKKKNFGYHLMVGNGTGALADNNKFKKIYVNVYGAFFNKRMLIGLYSDYDRFEWLPDFHHAQNMNKLTIGYKGDKITVGVAGFIRIGYNDVAVQTTLLEKDIINLTSVGFSLFARGKFYKDKLGFFARIDWFNPTLNYNENYYISYTGLSKHYEPSSKEWFASLGLDYAPVKNVHIMPNVWFNSYSNQRSTATGSTKFDFDLVYRLTFYFTFGK